MCPGESLGNQRTEGVRVGIVYVDEFELIGYNRRSTVQLLPQLPSLNPNRFNSIDTLRFTATKSVIEFRMDERSGLEDSRKKDWPTTPSAFQRLLNWLDGDMNSEGQKYLEMRRRLVAYFDRKNCATPDDLADETLDRVARRLEQENISKAEAPAKYCYIVARFVFMEHLRSSRQEGALASDLQRNSTEAIAAFDQAQEDKDTMLSCLEGCINKLEPESREISLGYYGGRGREKIENRRSLAQRLGITSNALSIRACRIRDRLENCVRECCREK